MTEIPHGQPRPRHEIASLSEDALRAEHALRWYFERRAQDDLERAHERLVEAIRRAQPYHDAMIARGVAPEDPDEVDDRGRIAPHG